jgi:hypothetical protein
MDDTESKCCEHCKHDCSPHAKACPQCGHDFHRYTTKMFHVLIWLAIMAIVLYLGSCFLNAFDQNPLGVILYLLIFALFSCIVRRWANSE